MCHDASPAWSGFNYQGKVALYTALTHINSTTNTNSLALELEWLEDFSIKDDSQYVSIHQVKGYADERLSQYSEAVFRLFEKIASGQAPKAYLHTRKILNLNGGTWHSGIKELLIQTLQARPGMISEFSAILNNDARITEIVNTLKHPTRGRPTDLARALRESARSYFENNAGDANSKLDVPTMKLILSDAIGKHRDELSRYTIQAGDMRILNRIELFSYPCGTCCELDYISHLIQEEIKHHYNITEQTWKANDPNHISRVYLRLLGEIDQHITSRHMEFKNKVKACISFSYLISILDGPISDNEEVYYLYHLRNELNTLRDQFCSRCIELLGIPASADEIKCQSCNLAYALTEINNINDECFKKLCKNTSPEVDSNEIDIHSYRQYLPERGLRSSVFESLSSLEREHCMDDTKITYNLENNEIALLTAIFHRDPKRFHEGERKSIANAIMKNSEMAETLREVDLMVSVDVDIPSISAASSKVSDVANECAEAFNEARRDEDSIIKMRRVSVRPIDLFLRRLS
jgi:hypothetical protein